MIWDVRYHEEGYMLPQEIAVRAGTKEEAEIYRSRINARSASMPNSRQCASLGNERNQVTKNGEGRKGKASMSIAITLIVAALSGIAWLASNYYQVFRDVLYSKLVFACGASAVFGTSFILGANAAVRTLIPFIAPANLDKARLAADELSRDYSYVVAGSIGLLMYFSFLLWLSGHIHSSKAESEAKKL